MDSLRFPSVLWHCWLGDRKGIGRVKSWRFDWTITGLVVTVVTSTYIILSSNDIRNGDILVPANTLGPPSSSTTSLLLVDRLAHLSYDWLAAWLTCVWWLWLVDKLAHLSVVVMKKNICFAESKLQNLGTNMNTEPGFQKAYPHRSRHPWQCWNDTGNKKEKEQYTIRYRSTLMNIHLCTNVIKKILLAIPSYSNNTHVRLPG